MCVLLKKKKMRSQLLWFARGPMELVISYLSIELFAPSRATALGRPPFEASACVSFAKLELASRCLLRASYLQTTPRRCNIERMQMSVSIRQSRVAAKSGRGLAAKSARQIIEMNA